MNTNNINLEFFRFLSMVPTNRLKQNLTKILSSYVECKIKEGLPDFMDDLLTDLMGLFELFDAIDREMVQH